MSESSEKPGLITEKPLDDDHMLQMIEVDQGYVRLELTKAGILSSEILGGGQASMRVSKVEAEAYFGAIETVEEYRLISEEVRSKLDETIQ